MGKPELTSGGSVVTELDLPKAGDFPAWNDLLANAIAPSSSADHVRGYLKSTADRAWRLVNWLTHASNATRSDAQLAVSATSHVISNYAVAVLKKESTRQNGVDDANPTR